jgi:S-DNA-T family DNA segregation ATPase FtsK/SpoIIIE
VGSTSLITAIEELVAGRRLAEEARDVPHMLLIVEDDAVVERSRLVALAESGPSVGVHLLWSSPSRERLPAACRSFVVVDDNGTATAGFPDEGRTVDLAVESLTLPAAAAMARDMAPLVDAGAPIDNASDLPRSVSYLALSGTALVDDATNVVDRWVETDSLASRRAPGRRRTPGSLRALVGQAATGPLYLDLRTQGPHALVGGTTGSGKSELLQSWVLGMAAAHSPERVTFLFVDYKGGSAFGECVRLPHSVGLVTDLSPHLVRRALVSLSAELRYREHILGAAKAKDLAEMEQSGDPLAPPSLVIVVDEFAALAHDVPEFVDGVVNIAQRGRSLGLHLILATQRPAGVIKDNLRANTNLRLALRMADAEDSTDILGTDVAASFDPAIPGRAAVRSGPGSLLAFQSAYVGGWTSEAVSGPEIVVRELSLRGTVPWDDVAPPAPASDGPNDLERLVEAITSAAEITAVAPPRRPWLPELPAVVELSALPTGRRDEQLVFALADSPMDQAQPPASFDPDRDGNLAVVGTGGSGKTTVLRSLAAAAGFTVRGGPVHVYGLDFGARGLAMLETLPHVGSVIAGDDVERVQRLFRWLRQTIDERSQRYAAVQASSITEYRIIAGRSDETRLLLMLDGFAAFRQAYDTTSNSGLMEALTALAADGRPVGVHVIIAADRMAAIPSSLASLVPRRLVLRAADENELSLLGVPRDLFGSDAPAGRGWLDGAEIQVGVLGGSTSLAAQAKAMDRLADAIRRNTTWPAAGDIGRLPDSVELSGLPADVGGSPVLGLEDESLAPIGLSMSGTFIVAGPPASGRSTTVTTIVRSAVRCRPGTRTVLLAPARSALLDVVPWHRSAVGLDPAAELVDQLLGEVTHDGEPWLLVVESPAEFLNTAADLPLQDLVKELRQEGHLVVGEGDTQSMAGSWPLLQAIRFSRRGIVLQPDQTDGDLLLRTSFPRVRRADFPAGRGLLVREGRVMKVQVARS